VGSAGGGSGVAGVGVAVGMAVGVGWPEMREIGTQGARANGASRSRPMIRKVSIGLRRRSTMGSLGWILADGG